MRKAELKVYTGWSMIDGKQRTVIVAASSQRTAVAALANFGIGISVRHLVTYWTITGNRKQCALALSAPEQAFAASSLDTDDYAPLPRRKLSQGATAAPKVPKDPEGRRAYDKEKRVDSDESKRARGERRLTAWIPKEAAEALDKITGGSAERGAVREALTDALIAYAALPRSKRKAA